MKIDLLCDEVGVETQGLVAALDSAVRTRGHHMSLSDTGRMHLDPCVGCFACWIKTPGVCVHTKDQGREFLKTWYESDLVLVVTRIPFGCYSPKMKKAMDRIIPLLLGDFRIFRGRMHHQLRYTKLPRLLHLTYGPADGHELRTFSDLVHANADNLGTVPMSRGFHFADGTDTAEAAGWFVQEARL